MLVGKIYGQVVCLQVPTNMLLDRRFDSLTNDMWILQVNKHYQELCSRDALRAWRAAEQGLVKAVDQENCRSNIRAAVTGSLKVAPLESFTNLHFSGDVTIVDPYVYLNQYSRFCR